MAGELKYAPIYFDNIEVLEMLPDCRLSILSEITRELKR